MMASQSQGEIGIERMCQLAGISRSGYYRHWQLSAPRREETGLRDAIQRLALKHRHYGYRRIGALLRREGWQANHKRVLRLMREDNLLCLPQFEPGPKRHRRLYRNRLQPPAPALGTGLSLARRVRSNIGEISGGDLTDRSLHRRELLLISCLTYGVHPISFRRHGLHNWAFWGESKSALEGV
jgi:transposase InsO family protein